MRVAARDPVAVQALDELRSGEARVDVAVLEALAEHPHALAPTAAVPELVAAAGLSLAPAPDLPPGVEALLVPTGLVLARPRRDTARARLAVLHEVAHHLLGCAALVHTHADVWALTLALAAPRSVVRALLAGAGGDVTPLHLAAATGMPAWAAEARLART